MEAIRVGFKVTDSRIVIES